MPPTLSLHCHGRQQKYITALSLAELRHHRTLHNRAFQAATTNPSVLVFMLKPISSRLGIFFKYAKILK